MQRIPLLMLALLLFSPGSAPVEAQEPTVRGAAGPLPAGPGRIDGTVTDTGGEPLASVAITLRSAADSALVTGALTDARGGFRIDGLPLGDYLLRVSVIGYRPRSSEVIALTAESRTAALGVIELETSPIQLDAVAAIADRPAVVVEADRTVYDARAMPAAAAGTATDVLRAVPELEVDVNDEVKLRGNQAVAIHLNGRPAPLRGEQLANFLRQLPGDRIDRIEVMPNPSARHDPEGMGGIVDIILKEDLDLGLSGSLGANVSTRNRRFMNGRLNYQRGPITLFSGAGVSTYQQDSWHHDLRQNLITDPVTFIEQDGRSGNRGRGGNLDWTAELRVGKQATLWSNAWMFLNTSGSNGLTEYGLLGADGATVLERYDRENDTDSSYGSYALGLGFKQVFEARKRELTIDSRISRGGNDRDSRHVRHYHVLDGEPVTAPDELTLNRVDAGNGYRSLQADYFRPLADGRLDLGYRLWQRTQDNDNALTVSETSQPDDPLRMLRSGYDYAERVHSLYATYARTFGRFSVQGGLRGERTGTRFESLISDAGFDRDYVSLFPSLNLAFTPRPGRTVRFLYSRRIQRPSPFFLDPFVPPTDPLNVFVGNPDLRPSHTDAVSLELNWNGRLGTLRVAPYQRTTTDIWERIRTVDTLGVATSRWENGRSAKAYGSNFTVSLRPAGRVSGSTSFNLYRDVRDGTNISSEYRRAAFLWSLGGNVSGKLTESLTAQIFANHYPPQSILQGRASGYTFTSIALRQQVRGTRGNISVSVNDPLNLFRFDSSTRDATYIQTSRSSFSSRMVRVGFTYNFGRPPERQSRPATGEPDQAGETIRVR